jgi:hypothetical protein
MIDHLSLKVCAAAVLAGAHSQTGIEAIVTIPKSTLMNGLTPNVKTEEQR